MKQIIAYIRPIMLDKVTQALKQVEGLTGMSVVEIRGFGRGRGLFGEERQEEEITSFRRKLRIEIMAADSLASIVVDTIRENASTGEQGEGKIYVLNVEEAVRIRTNERGEAAV